MCGIVGLVKKNKIDKKHIESINYLLKNLVHRGPDEEGKYLGHNVILMMRRLSIIGLQNGKQPFFSKNKNIVVVVNGEIYNYKELKKELLKKKIKFKTKSDCEVIIGLYQLYGLKLTDKLRGMFAISIYDKKKNKLFLIRDRMGEKPIYYFSSKETFLFSSELRNILKYPEIDKKIDPEAINQYFHFGYIVEPRSPFDTIKKVEAGSILEIDTVTLKKKINFYWSINGIKNKKKKTDINKILNKLNDSCRYVATSDVNVALANSGGADSGVIFDNLINNNNKFTSIFIKNRNKEHDVVNPNNKIKKNNTIKFFEKDVSENQLIKNFVSTVLSKDEPIADISSSNYFELLKFSKKKKLKVIIFGHGGDELFWGYDWYNESALITRFLNSNKIIAFFLLWISQIKKINNIKKYLKAPLDLFGLVSAINIFKKTKNNFSKKRFLTYENHTEFQLFEEIKKKFFSNKFYSSIVFKNPCDELYKKYRNLDNQRIFFLNFILKTYMQSNGISQNDRISMFHSVELRLPYMDHHLIEEIARSEYQNQTNDFSKKYFINALKVRGIVNKEKYKKVGFTTSLNWTELIFKNFDHLLEDSILIKTGIMSKNFHNFSPIKLKLIILEIWFRDVLK